MKRYSFIVPLVLLMAAMLACNLARQVPATGLPPSATFGARFTPQPGLPSITPLFGNAAGTPGVVVSTPLPGAQVAITPGVNLGVTLAPRSTPGNVTVTIPTGQIGDFLSYVFNNIILPIVNIGVNMVGSSATYLWQMAGAQGGWIGQVGCCIVPVIVLIAVVLRGGRRSRRRWFGIF